MARKTNSTTAPATIAAKMKAAEALRLRVQGHSFDAIAELAGYKSRQAAYDATRRAIREILREPVEELIALDTARLDAIWGVQFANAMNGDVQAAHCCLKVLQQRARLLGLDASPKEAQPPEPTRVMLVPVFESPDAWEQAAIASQAALKKAVRE